MVKMTGADNANRTRRFMNCYLFEFGHGGRGSGNVPDAADQSAISLAMQEPVEHKAS
jgi:hypothetical protein